MRVYIGPYTTWLGPYQIADKIPFVSEETRDKIGEWLANTWVADVCSWIDSKKERKIKIRIDKYDTWNMDSTLALIIVPMLKQLRETKHGAPMVDNDDVPVHMRYDDAAPVYNENDEYIYPTTQWFMHKWDWVLNEMIWAFEQYDTDWEQQYVIQKGEIDWEDYPEDEGKDAIPLRWKKECIINFEGRQAHQERIANGIRLFGKYYQNLWD
jgi:hypothetical protein